MSTKEKVIALGFFDGVHLGHAALLRRTVEEAKARGVTPAVFTFDRVPKEVITGIMSLISIGKTGRVDGSQWHGKLTTVLLYAMIVDRIVPWLFSVLLTLACAGMMVFSMVMYWKRNRDSIREAT